MERNLLRKKILIARDNLPPEIRKEKSLLIRDRLLNIKACSLAETVMLYVSFRSEVDTMPLFSHCLANGKKVAVPLTLPHEKRLVPYAITDPKHDLRPGYCSIPEPDPERATPVIPGTIDMVILPGSVFDINGNRLGYGGGYYDRFLALEAPQALRIGVAFELQIVSKVPSLPHDMPLDYLVTEERAIKIHHR